MAAGRGACPASQSGSPSPPLRRPKVVALVTVEVHARDVIEKLIKAGASSPTDFEWASQLRFYWDRDANDCVVKQARRGLRKRVAKACGWREGKGRPHERVICAGARHGGATAAQHLPAAPAVLRC